MSNIRWPWQPSRLKDFFQSIWNFLLSQTGTFLIGVSAIAVGTYQFYINKPILKYQTAVTNIVSSINDNEIKVTVKEKEYKDLYQTTVILTSGFIGFYLCTYRSIGITVTSSSKPVSYTHLEY